MPELTERSWKHRFAERLARAFADGGLEPIAALEDAYAHADDQYPKRGEATPEREAVAVYESILGNPAA